MASSGRPDAVGDDLALPSERGACKPDPEVIRTALERLGVHPAEALMVGDRPGHAGAAVEAGITTLFGPANSSVRGARQRSVRGM
ncbi:HAD-IA family hydrolase [Streptomyces fagopyri]|uniref:HAD-IA family hydrolase n=1 Tax=Streptomyces fagopyri TaxID=2662397 RepID=UPI00389ADCA0